jgi:predicted lipoprotein with Yx(FWY)xxD motif
VSIALHCAAYHRLSLAEGATDLSIEIPPDTATTVTTAAASAATTAAATTTATTDDDSRLHSPQGSDDYVMLSTDNSATSQCDSDSDNEWLIVR